jgi:hypothetical protein
MGLISMMKYVPLLFSRNVTSVMTEHAQQTAALSRRRWMTAPALCIMRLLYRILTTIIAGRGHEFERARYKRLN